VRPQPLEADGCEARLEARARQGSVIRPRTKLRGEWGLLREMHSGENRLPPARAPLEMEIVNFEWFSPAFNGHLRRI
jgi:hypothetical protein